MRSEPMEAIKRLRDQLEAALTCEMKNQSFQEQIKFAKEHPGAHFVIGDFEIKCLHPEKYNL